jgi:hypothetical protein
MGDNRNWPDGSNAKVSMPTCQRLSGVALRTPSIPETFEALRYLGHSWEPSRTLVECQQERQVCLAKSSRQSSGHACIHESRCGRHADQTGDLGDRVSRYTSIRSGRNPAPGGNEATDRYPAAGA